MELGIPFGEVLEGIFLGGGGKETCPQLLYMN